MIDRSPGGDVDFWKRWCNLAGKYPNRDAVIHWFADAAPIRWSYANLIEAANKWAAKLLDHGVGKGQVCAIIIRHNPQLYPLYLACVSIGAVPAVLAYPNSRLHPDKFRDGLAGMSQKSGLDWILTERELEPTIRPLVATTGKSIQGLHFPLEWSDAEFDEGQKQTLVERREAIRPTDPLLLQHSSGTTGLQKPVLLSHRAVLEHVDRYAGALGLHSDDKIVSWLPLYHDMGLIAAFHLPLAVGIPTVQIDPFDWVRSPSILLDVVSKERGTVTWLPNFAYDLMADKIAHHDLDGINLAHWRLVINCSEPIRHESQTKFLTRFGSYGLQPLALSTCYAMAETTFAVTQTPPGVEPARRVVDRKALAVGTVADITPGQTGRAVVSSGSAINGCDVRIVDDDGSDVSSDRVGELLIRSVSMFEGYRNYPEKTASVLRDGWYRSGDYGFRDGSNYYVVGRKKDLIIVAGNNIYPEDVETAVGTVDGVIPGRVVAFGEEDVKLGTERLCVAVETNLSGDVEKRRLRIEIVKAGMSIDVSIAKVYLVSPRFLIKSSAGKLSRDATRTRLMDSSQASTV